MLLLDTGPFVAMIRANDPHHDWALSTLQQQREPLLTCDAVLSETSFILRRYKQDPARAFNLIERGVIRLAFNLAEEFTAVRELFTRYDSVPASLADACLVRMSELHPQAQVMTLDGDFLIYRKSRKQPIEVLSPFA